MPSLRDLILAAADCKREAVAVPEWTDENGQPLTIYVHEMNAAQRADWYSAESAAAQPEADEEGAAAGHAAPDDAYLARLLVHCLCDENGKRLFTAEDVSALAGKNAEVIIRLYLIAKRLNGIGSVAIEAAKKKLLTQGEALFEMKLCLALGMTRAELRQRMTSSELTDWAAFNDLCPFGEERADWRMARFAALYANSIRSPNDPPVQPADFMWNIDRQKKQTPEEIDAAIDAALDAIEAHQ